jgi:hypothetical protein
LRQRYLAEKAMGHTRGKPYHPMTQGKIARHPRTMKNVVKLQNYYVPWDLEREIERFVRWYNEERYHESLENLTPQDVYLGRRREIQTTRQRLKAQTLRKRKWYNQGRERKKGGANHTVTGEAECPLAIEPFCVTGLTTYRSTISPRGLSHKRGRCQIGLAASAGQRETPPLHSSGVSNHQPVG